MNWETQKIVEANRDKLRDAFRRMRKTKLVARMNFSCCGNCGAYELGSMVQEAGGSKLGYAFFHHQDNDRLESSGKVMLCYGPWYPPNDSDDQLHDERTTIIGTLVLAALLREGLAVEWDGTPQQRIEVDLTH